MRVLAPAMLAAVAVAATSPALAADIIKVAIGQRGNWETAASELGQNAGLFEKRGLRLELLYTNGSAETLQAVISGSVDIGVGLGTTSVMAAYAKGAPLRAIGNASTGSSEYWYVPATSPIRGMRDAAGKTIAFSTTGSSSNLIVRTFIKTYGLMAKAVATGGPAATFTQVMSGQIDVGWSSPPFGLDAARDGRIRIIARGNDLAEFRDQTIRLIVANATFAQRHRDVVSRYAQGYRDAIAYMYSDPAGLAAYADLAKTSLANAQDVRDIYYPHDNFTVDHISGLADAMADGVALKYLARPLTAGELADFFQIPDPIR